jgi:hypothetical protein
VVVVDVVSYKSVRFSLVSLCLSSIDCLLLEREREGLLTDEFDLLLGV